MSAFASYVYSTQHTCPSKSALFPIRNITYRKHNQSPSSPIIMCEYMLQCTQLSWSNPKSLASPSQLFLRTVLPPSLPLCPSFLPPSFPPTPPSLPYRVRIGQIPGVGEPTTQVVISASSGDVIHHQCPSCSSVVTSCHSSTKMKSMVHAATTTTTSDT